MSAGSLLMWLLPNPMFASTLLHPSPSCRMSLDVHQEVSNSGAERVDIHIAVARLPIPPSVNALVAKLKSFLEGSGWEGADLRIWLDQLDGDNVVQDQ